MNACSNWCFGKWPINLTHNRTRYIFYMIQTSSLLRLFAVRSAGEVWSSFTKQCIALLDSCFIGSNGSCASIAKGGNHFSCSSVFSKCTKKIGMTISHVFTLCQTFKVICSIVSLITINVVHVFFWIKRFKPAFCNYTVHESLTTKAQITMIMKMWCIRLMLSKNFPTARNRIEVVKESVFDSVYFNVQHVGSSWSLW